MGNLTMEGGCLCGEVRYRAEGEHGRITHCHCIHCQKSTGAPMVTWVEMPRSGFTLISGNLTRYNQSEKVTREHCSRCGSQIIYQTSKTPETIELTAGSMDDPSLVTPQNHVWHKRRVPWLHLSDDLPRFDKERV